MNCYSCELPLIPRQKANITAFRNSCDCPYQSYECTLQNKIYYFDIDIFHNNSTYSFHGDLTRAVVRVQGGYQTFSAKVKSFDFPALKEAFLKAIKLSNFQ